MRVTVDIDGNDKAWWAWSVYYMMKNMDEFSRVEIWKTKNGFHIIGYGSGLSEIEANLLRASFGDDKIRLAIDSAKIYGQPKQVLWNKKNGYEVFMLECSLQENRAEI